MKPRSKVYAATDLNAVTANIKVMRDNLPPFIAIVGAVKTDGYGHGVVPVVRTTDPYVEGYAVTPIDEGITLRRHGIRKMILILGMTRGSRFKELVHYDIRPAMSRYEEVRKLSGTAVKTGKKANIHLAVDMRMNRIGMKSDERSAGMACRMGRLGGIRTEGMFIHLAKVDELDKTVYTARYGTYTDLMDMLSARDVTIPIRHCPNSTGIVESLESNEPDTVRAGISIYGLYSSGEVGRDAVKLMPAVGLKGFITYIETVEPGNQVSYGGTFVADGTIRVATIPVGYRDGYLRSLSGKGSVLVRGQRTRILEHACMDQFMVGATDIPDASEDDRVILIERDGEEYISVEELARISGGFHYEVACGIGKRVPKVYLGDNWIIGKRNYFNDICEGFRYIQKLTMFQMRV